MPARTRLDTWRQLPQPFLHKEATAAGLSGHAISRGVADGPLTRLGDGLFVVARDWEAEDETTQHRSLCRAALAAVPDTVLSHASAALVFALPRPTRPSPKVTLLSLTEQSLTGAPDDWKRVLHGAVSADEWTEREGLRLTIAPRTVIDCLRTLGLQDGLAMADAAVRRGLASREELEDVRARQVRWPGVRQADEGLALLDGRRESWLESASVVVASRHGFSTPVAQVSIHRLDGRFIGRADHVWHGAGVIGEADGLGKYRGDFDDEGLSADSVARRVLAERDRERGLEALGFGVARWGTDDLRDGGAGLVRSLREARRRARPGSIECLWRLGMGEPLRPWREFAHFVGELAA